jgi:hypothetical protein
MRKTHGKKQTRKNKTKKRAIRGGVRIKGPLARGYGFGNNAREAARTNFGNRCVYKPSTNKYDNKKDNKPSENNDKNDNSDFKARKSTAQEPPQ